MAIIQKIKFFLSKKIYFFKLWNNKFLSIQKFNPFVLISFVVVFSIVFSEVFEISAFIRHRKACDAEMSKSLSPYACAAKTFA